MNKDEELVKSIFLITMGYVVAIMGHDMLRNNDLCAIWVMAISFMYTITGCQNIEDEVIS